jgi:hypothetical protein
MKYMLIKVQEYEKSGNHEFCEFSIAEDWNGKPGNYIASLVPCHKGSEELEKDATEIVEKLNTIEAQAKRIAELEAALESLQYYVGNPSAWESYDEDMSERIRRACEVAEPKFWTKG